MSDAKTDKRTPDPQFFDADGNYLDGPHYGKDCPVGKVQIEFVGVSPELRYSPYGWKPADHAFIDIYIDGRRYNIQVGDFESADGVRRGLHIVTDPGVKVDGHSINALDVFFDAPPAKAEPR